MINETARQNFNAQKWVLLIGIILFAIKVAAWLMTRSVAILTDALESTVNVLAAGIGLYSLYLSGQPKDHNHPYGHGKVEFISSGIEGALIFLAGVFIIFEAVDGLLHPKPITRLDIGLIFIAFSGLVNYLAGTYAVKLGNKNNSPALVASGKHLKTDTYTTIGIMVGLGIILITGIEWIDKVVAIIFAGLIMVTGIRIIRKSASGIMDETDQKLVNEVVIFLQENRRPNWIDIHNLRIIQYGSQLHIDCHITVPWYFNVQEAHEEIDILEKKANEAFGNRVEIFAHTDFCYESACSICTKEQCPERKHPFEKKLEWTFENVSRNGRHQEEV
jgi:cation diffusion facilitator family transporter